MSSVTVLRSLKGGSLSKTEVVQTQEGELRVRKSISRREDREYGLVRWQSQVRKLQYLKRILPKNVPDMLEFGVNGNFFYYDMPYYNDSVNLYEYLKTADTVEGKTTFKKVEEIINSYSALGFGNILGTAALFYHEEIDTRLSVAEKWIQQDTSTIFSEDERRHIVTTIQEFSQFKAHICSFLASLKVEECLTHGNLTLENVLYDKASGKLILIDPYAETYCESVLGDYSQLLQSCESNYEQIVEVAEHQEISLLEPYVLPKLNAVEEFNACLQAYLDGYSSIDRTLVGIFHGGQFIRMFPFKVQKNPKLAFYFMLHGLAILMRQSDVI